MRSERGHLDEEGFVRFLLDEAHRVRSQDIGEVIFRLEAVLNDLTILIERVAKLRIPVPRDEPMVPSRPGGMLLRLVSVQVFAEECRAVASRGK